MLKTFVIFLLWLIGINYPINGGYTTAPITGINNGSISSACIGKYRTAGGFIWKFKT
jgi:hypothetical protein